MVWPSKKPRRTSPNWTNNVETGDAKPESVKAAQKPRMGQINPIGKSNRSTERRRWDKELKEWWKNEVGIFVCELRYAGCMNDFGFALCHSKRRRFIKTREDYFEVVGGCVFCHNILDTQFSHDLTEQIVKHIIANRGK